MSAKIDGIKNLISDNNTLEFYVDYFKATPKGLNKGQMSALKALTSTYDSISIDPKHSQPFDLLSIDKPKLITNGSKKPNAHDMDDTVVETAEEI